MAKNDKPIAEQALEATGTSAATEGAAKPATNSKYQPGVYRADKFMRIIKAITMQHKTDASGQVQKTYGTWTKDDNMIIFQKGVEKRLSAEDVALPTIQRLIDSKAIYKVGD